MPDKDDNDTDEEDFGCCPIPDCLEARTIERGSDRRAFARRTIREGEVILKNAPNAHTLLPAHKEERCARCLSTSRKGDTTTKTNLMRCGGCKQIWYCSRDCQKEDFAFHKFECKQSSVLFPSQQQQGSIDNARLLVRNFLALNLQGDTDTTMCSKQMGKISCGFKHFDNLLQYDKALDAQELFDIQRASQALWNQRKKIQISNSAIFERLSVLERHLEADLRRFRANNFGVTDAMARVVASAVYPLGALLNHSCAPNCLLRYNFGGKTPIMEIVAAQEIPVGEELTHSYVELVSAKESRQNSLKEIFGFDCHCERCANSNGSFRISLPHDHGSLSPIELSRWVLQNYNPNSTTSDDSSLIFMDQELILVPQASQNATYRAVVEGANAKQQQAQYFMVSGDLESELACLKDAVQMLENSLAQATNDNWLLLSLDLYKARCTRFGSLIVAGESYANEALMECEHIVAYLCLALQHVPNHSLLGLQLFTLGDVYDAQGEQNKARRTYEWARRVLRVSQGKESDMVQLLNEKLG